MRKHVLEIFSVCVLYAAFPEAAQWVTQRTELAQPGEAGNTREETHCVAISGNGGNASVWFLPALDGQ